MKLATHTHVFWCVLDATYAIQSLFSHFIDFLCPFVVANFHDRKNLRNASASFPQSTIVIQRWSYLTAHY